MLTDRQAAVVVRGLGKMHRIYQRPQDVIADIRLGGILSREGLAILDFIKRRDGNTKVIIMTGFGGPDVMKEAYHLQADYYFEKPVSYKTLSLALSELGVMDHENA